MGAVLYSLLGKKWENIQGKLDSSKINHDIEGSNIDLK
jgi:hypothetical protein